MFHAPSWRTKCFAQWAENIQVHVLQERAREDAIYNLHRLENILGAIVREVLNSARAEIRNHQGEVEQLVEKLQEIFSRQHCIGERGKPELFQSIWDRETQKTGAILRGYIL